MTDERKAVEALREEWAKLKEALLPVLVTSGLFRGAASIPSVKAFEAALDAAQGEAMTKGERERVADYILQNMADYDDEPIRDFCERVREGEFADAAQVEAGPSREALMQVFRAATLWAYQFREGERAGDAATLLLLQLTRCESESGGSNG